MLAAVVRPLTISPRARIAPAPRNPMPETTCAAIREGSSTTFCWVRMFANPYCETIMIRHDPTQTSMCVLIPAAHSRRSRSNPMRLPSAAASSSRRSISVLDIITSGIEARLVPGLRRPFRQISDHLAAKSHGIILIHAVPGNQKTLYEEATQRAWTRMNVIYFDLDGTLTNPKPGITRSIQYALGKLDRAVPTEDELTWCIGPPLHASLKKLLGTDDLADAA